jgi:hypothetical protein
MDKRAAHERLSFKNWLTRPSWQSLKLEPHIRKQATAQKLSRPSEQRRFRTLYKIMRQ